MRGLVALVVLLSGCGRIGFDALSQSDARGGDGGAVDLTFSSFSPCPTELVLVGSAACVGGELELTAEVANQTGAAWIASPFATDRSFSIEVTFVFTNLVGQPADGAAITVQNAPAGSSALGIGGQGFGIKDLGPSVNVETDLLSNSEPAVFQHIGIDVDGQVAPGGPAVNTPFDMADGQPFTVWFDYAAAAHRVDVYVDRTTTKPTAAFVTSTADVSHLGSQMYIGVSAATGVIDAQHHVLAWSVDFL